MTQLKEKSKFNLEAAKVLIDDHDCYAPSVHCSYYGCFQFIKSKLNTIGFTYEMISTELASDTRKSSHNYPISLILNEVERKSDSHYKSNVRNKIKLLKTFRVESDYHNEIVNYDKSRKSLDLSKEIIKLIENKL